MSLQGSLRTMTVPELLMWISQSQKTGTLEIRTRQSTQRLAFESGTLTFSSSSDRTRTLGRLMIEKGILTEELHEKARRLRKKKVAVAKALLDLHILTEDEVMRFLRKKAESELFDLFDCAEGEFSFDERELPQLQLLPMRVDVSNLLLRLTQQMDEKGKYDFDASGIRLDIPSDS